MITIEEIENLAALSRIELTPEEKEKMRREFDAILGYVASLREVSATSASDSFTKESSRSIIATVNMMREDTPPAGGPHESGIYTQALVGAAPRREGDYIKVKKIL